MSQTSIYLWWFFFIHFLKNHPKTDIRYRYQYAEIAIYLGNNALEQCSDRIVFSKYIMINENNEVSLNNISRGIMDITQHLVQIRLGVAISKLTITKFIDIVKRFEIKRSPRWYRLYSHHLPWVYYTWWVHQTKLSWRYKFADSVCKMTRLPCSMCQKYIYVSSSGARHNSKTVFPRYGDSHVKDNL